MVNNILKGSIFITDNIEVIRNINLGPTLRIIDMDEDRQLPDTKDIICATNLLPPVEAKIAEADGDEIKYDYIYSEHLKSQDQYEYISALISYLFLGGNLIFYLPEYGYNNTLKKFVYHFTMLYGIHIGFINSPDQFEASYFYDYNFTSLWLKMIYCSNVIDAYQFLTLYPDYEAIDNFIMNKIIQELCPYTNKNSINSKIEYIDHLKQILKENPKAKVALIDNNTMYLGV